MLTFGGPEGGLDEVDAEAVEEDDASASCAEGALDAEPMPSCAFVAILGVEPASLWPFEDGVDASVCDDCSAVCAEEGLDLAGPATSSFCECAGASVWRG